MSATHHVIVVGAGVIGLATAYRLRREGHAVTLLDRSVVGSGAARTNAGWVTPSLSEPVPSPAALRVALRTLGRRDAPLSIRFRADPRYLGFLLRMLASCRPSVFARGLAANASLAAGAVDAFADLRADGLAFEHHPDGVLLTFLDAHHGDRYAMDLARMRAWGVPAAEQLDAAQLTRVAPHLSAAVRAGVLCPGDEHVDPSSFVDALVVGCRTSGVEIHERQEITSIRSTDGGVRVNTTTGTRSGSHVVIAGGTESASLAAMVGHRLPILAGKGYVLDLPSRGTPTPALYLSEAKVAVSPLQGGLRLAGVMEFGAVDTSVTKRRVTSLRASAQRYFAEPLDVPLTAAAGMRPMTPDGLPVIGRLDRDGRVLIATGHGMLGVTLAPLTANLILGELTGHRLHPEYGAFSPERFHRVR